MTSVTFAAVYLVGGPSWKRAREKGEEKDA